MPVVPGTTVFKDRPVPRSQRLIMQVDYAKLMQNDYAEFMQNDYAKKFRQNDYAKFMHDVYAKFMHRLHCKKRRAYRQAVGLKLYNHLLIARFNQPSKGYYWVLTG
jgi:hypothetical protein